MCRLLGFVSDAPTTLENLLGTAELKEFEELSAVHKDGWGFAVATDDGIEVTKEPQSARMSTLFSSVASSVTAEVGLLHLRWATLGLDVIPENTHPFTDGAIAFIHNGSISPPSSVDRLIPEDLASRRRGSSDSERYFLAVLAQALEGDATTALARAAALISRECAFTSLNAMLITRDELQVVNLFDPDADFTDVGPNYYRLGYRVSNGSVVVSSSGWGTEWTFLENGDFLTVDHRTREVKIRNIDSIEPRG